MAYEHKGPAPDGGKFYNVEQAVGATGVNAQGDVKLVQYMLRNIYGAQASALAVDGWIGPTTISWIKKFQTDAKAGGANVLVDGRIDRALANVSSVSKTIYAVLAMNRALRQKDPSAYAKLPSLVPLNAVPKANPYNPKIKTVAYTFRIYTSAGWKITNVYSDGTEEIVLVDGPVFVDGQLYHGRVVGVSAVTGTDGMCKGLLYTYEDGYMQYVPAQSKGTSGHWVGGG